MNYALALIMIGFCAGVLAILLTKHLVNRNTERDEDIVPDGMEHLKAQYAERGCISHE